MLPSYIADYFASIGRSAAAVDREEIRSAIAEWGVYRDTGQFERLRALFAPGATIQTTWFDGNADEFVDRSKATFGGGARAHHFFGASKIDLHGDRATADTRIMLQLRTAIEGIWVDATCYGRVFDFFVRHEKAWRILRRVPVYDKEEERRQERRRLKQRDEHRWHQLCAFATDWQERTRLLNFLAEIESRSPAEANATIAEQQLSEWIAWAQQKIDSLDPFQNGIAGLFEKVSASIPPFHQTWIDTQQDGISSRSEPNTNQF